METTATLLKDGGTVAVPTETVYGLAADASNPEAVRAIFNAKGRPSNHPLIVHLASADELTDWAIDIPAEAFTLANEFWPGPLTLLLKKAAQVSYGVTGGLETIALRVPSNPVFHELLGRTGLGLAAPSANLYKQLSPTSAAQVFERMEGRINAVLDGGQCSIGLESTIVDLTTNSISVLRAGPITPSALSACLNQPVSLPAQHQVAVPGNVDDHYQPNTPLYLLTHAEMQERLRHPDEKSGYVLLGDSLIAQGRDSSSGITVMPEGKADYSHQLYSTLYGLDSKKLTAIWVELPPQIEEWLDVNDRLQRAAYFRPVDMND